MPGLLQTDVTSSGRLYAAIAAEVGLRVNGVLARAGTTVDLLLRDCCMLDRINSHNLVDLFRSSSAHCCLRSLEVLPPLALLQQQMALLWQYWVSVAAATTI
jgi:hypothetical protein